MNNNTTKRYDATTDWENIPFSYALIADPKHRIINRDDVLDESAVLLVGSYADCDRELARLVAAAYEARCDRFEAAYDAHIEKMACGDY